MAILLYFSNIIHSNILLLSLFTLKKHILLLLIIMINCLAVILLPIIPNKKQAGNIEKSRINTGFFSIIPNKKLSLGSNGTHGGRVNIGFGQRPGDFIIFAETGCTAFICTRREPFYAANPTRPCTIPIRKNKQTKKGRAPNEHVPGILCSFPNLPPSCITHYHRLSVRQAFARLSDGVVSGVCGLRRGCPNRGWLGRAFSGCSPRPARRCQILF